MNKVINQRLCTESQYLRKKCNYKQIIQIFMTTCTESHFSIKFSKFRTVVTTGKRVDRNGNVEKYLRLSFLMR